MTKKVELTPEQIRDIYNAGCSRGEREQSAYDWGSAVGSKREDDMVWDVAEILNVTAEVAVELLSQSSNGLGLLTFNQENAGSNPVCDTKK